MTWCQRNDDDLSAPAFDIRRTDDRVVRVIAALDDHIGPEMSDQVKRCVLRENYDEIDALERRENVGALRVGADGPCRALEATYRFIAIDADYQRVGRLSRGGKHVDMARMKQVEHAVGKCHSTFSARPPALRFDPGCNLCGRIPWLQSLLTARGWKWSTCSFFRGSLMTSS